jgi:hypothetical protein
MAQWKITALGFITGFALALGDVAVADAPATAPEPGVWQKHDYNFQFMGFTTTYSCDGLATKLKSLLIAAGARADVQSNPGACANGFGRPDKFANARVTFYTLATPGEATAVTAPTVEGAWRGVSFAHHSPRDLATGDCELIEQFREHLLPLLTTRNLDDHTTCVPYQDSGSNIDLKFESFAAVPSKPALASTGSIGR